MPPLPSTISTVPGQRDLSDLIYLFIKTTPRSLTFSSACAVAIEGLILGIILVQTTKYLSAFWRTDPLWSVSGIVLGAATLFAQLGMNLWQTYRLIDRAATDLLAIIIGDIRCNMTVLVFVGILNFVAAGFFGRRAWLLSKKKIWSAFPLVIGIFSSLGLSLGVAIKGYMLPSLATNPSAENLMEYDSWRKTDNRLIVVWAAIALVQDILVCALMTIMLLKEKDGFQKTETSLLRLLLKLTYETMAGPVVLNIVNVVVVALQGATFAGYSRIVTWILGPVYFSSILQSLNYRKDVQRVLHVTPTPRSRSTSKGTKRSTLQRVDSPSMSIPLTPTGLGRHTRDDSNITAVGNVKRSSETSAAAAETRRERTVSAGGGSTLSTDIVLDGEKR
ncbi:hypothetical protein I204_02863 [Kwoniella mangroviensis CBS 8886]|uniref:hypothetical protein n=1 Tax=Kwoniella mangroviensis CBS 8507 TaxID=1296122 RepID=UPI00080D7F74|nr:uncharacterized protein I203_01767 [Kwoniella mangroviensis CBS 8507]OCF68387.1 hypothetical protein I203_01767 [Kwoniella mangroviensis CBS 8507]OCF77151.1 hypothetical protein I204_02863 [Kwoniella mangroviensis CBS 8886]